jgi:hypothetical protein
MLRVPLADEPATFTERVRLPGQTFLRATPHPTTGQFQRAAYWTKVLRDMHDLYNGICAYSCLYIPYTTGRDTVEHFIPKSKNPELAYEWTNYRLVCGRLNGRKREFIDVIDPVGIQNGWFVLKFPMTLVAAAKGLPDWLTPRIDETIKRLKLNEDGQCVKDRFKWVKDYADGGISFIHLKRHAPFIAYELERQDLVED